MTEAQPGDSSNINIVERDNHHYFQQTLNRPGYYFQYPVYFGQNKSDMFRPQYSSLTNTLIETCRKEEEKMATKAAADSSTDSIPSQSTESEYSFF